MRDHRGSRRQFMGMVGVAAGPSFPPFEVLAAPPLAAAAAQAGGRPAPLPAAAAGGLPGVFEVTRFGAVPDGRTMATEALQRAIDACGAAGGGVVLVPPGRYLTGALSLRSHVHLYLSAGAVLLASQRSEDFPPVEGREEGIERTVHASLINGVDLEKVSITGQGRIDGQGAPWWQAYEQTRSIRLAAKLPREAPDPPGVPLKLPKPRLIHLQRCRQSLVEGLTFVDSPGVNIHLLYCQDALVQGITSYQTRTARSTEAVLIDSSKRVRVIGSHLSSGSDCIGIKSGYNEDGRRVGIASEDIVIANCNMNKMTVGVVLGSETSGSIRNVVITGCVMRDCFSAVRIRAPRGRGGVVEGVRVSDLLIDGATEMGIKISNFFDSARSEGRAIKSDPGRQNPEMARSIKLPVDETTPTFRDFSFSGVTMSRVREVAMVEGLPERFVRGVVFEDILVTRAVGGITSTMASEVSVSNFTADALETPAVDAREVTHLEVHRVRCARPPAGAPLVFMENVAGAFVHGCQVGERGDKDWVRQLQCRDVTLVANHITTPAAPPRGK